jgi:DNA phosphorothioation-dependent restriction protein DptG
MALTANQLSLPPLLKRTMKEEKNSQSNNNFDSIKVSQKINSLTNVLDALDQMPEYDKNIENEQFRSTNTDMFKSRKNLTEQEKEKFKESINASLEEINKFNHSIMKNMMWGQGSQNKQKPNTANKMPIKPDQKELEKEMGKTIVNTKMPRSRHFSKIEKMKK